ncbi:MAG: 50S ribosomal protein L35 [Acidobacteriota bacterium]
MPKLKTHRGAKKRIKVTGSGKLMRMKANASHILTKKNRKRKRNLKKAVVVVKEEFKRIKDLLPYS